MAKISDSQFMAAVEMIKTREALIKSVSDITAEINRLTELRSETFSGVVKLRNKEIAAAVGIGKFAVDNISRNKYKRVRALDREFFDRK